MTADEATSLDGRVNEFLQQLLSLEPVAVNLRYQLQATESLPKLTQH